MTYSNDSVIVIIELVHGPAHSRPIFPAHFLAVGRWFPPGTPVSSTRKLISSSSFHRLDMTLAVAEALTPINQTKPNPAHFSFPVLSTIQTNYRNYVIQIFLTFHSDHK